MCFEYNLWALSRPIEAAEITHFNGPAHGVTFNNPLVDHRHIASGSASGDRPFDLISFECSLSGNLIALTSFHGDRDLFSIQLKMNGTGPFSSLCYHRHFPVARYIHILGSRRADQKENEC